MSIAGTLALAATLAASWTLPRTAEVKERGPRTYRFTNLYTATNQVGDVVHRHQLTAEYTRGLPGGEVVWRDVVARVALGPTDPLPAGERREFMEGFRYPRGTTRLFEADFFQAFPPAAVHERNLVWDVTMLEAFGESQFPHLRLNQPYQVARRQDLALPGIGTFQNRDVQLTWVGRSRRNGVDCAVIDYTAFSNPLRIDAGGVRISGLSHYWGQIWVSTSTRMVEYATIREVVYGEMKLPGQEAAQPMNVFRESVLEPAPR
jgi:hypothetical protein